MTTVRDPAMLRIGPLHLGYAPLLAIILIAAAVVRFMGLDWDNGYYLHPDERFMVMVTSDIAWPSSIGGWFDSVTSPLNPYNTQHGTFVYGTFPVFLTKAINSLIGNDVYGAQHLVGRGLSALFDTGTVFLTAWIARRFFGRHAGLIAATLAAFTMLHIQSAHFYTVDAMSVFFAIAVFVCVLKGWDTRRIRWYALAGLMLGLTGASKPNYLIALGFFALPVLETIRLFGIDGILPRRERRTLPLIPALTIGGLFAFWTFRIAQPYAFSGPHLWNIGLNHQWLDDLSYWSAAQSGLIDVKSSIQWADRTPILFILENLIRWGMGPFLGLASLAALALASWRMVRSPGWPSWWITGIIGWCVIHLGLYGLNIAQAQRYLFAIYPFLIAFAAGFLVELVRWCRNRWNLTNVSNPAYYLLAATIIYTVLYGTAFATIYTRPITRESASEWIYDNVPAGSTLTAEYWDDALPMYLPGEDRGQYSILTLDLYASEERGSTKLTELIGQLNAADYIILSSNRIIGSVPRQESRYPMATHYYEMLLNGDLGFELVAEFTQGPQLGPLEWDDRNAEEMLTVYEHPWVRIFQKTDAYDSNAVYTELDQALGYGGFVWIPGDPTTDQMLLTTERQDELDANGTWHRIYNPESSANEFPTFYWLVGMQIMALAVLPLSLRWFGVMPDRGWMMAMPLGLLLIPWLGWMLSHVPFLGFSRAPIIIAGALVLGLGVVLEARSFADHVRSLRQRWRWLVAGEALYITIWLIAIAIRSLTSAAWTPGGTDSGLLSLAMFNAAARSSSMPPFDAWLSGGQLHAPWWGMLPWITLTRLLGIIPNVAYSLAIVSILTVTATTLWIVAATILRRQRLTASLARILAFVAPAMGIFGGSLIVTAVAAAGTWALPAQPADWPVPGLPGRIVYGVITLIRNRPEVSTAWFDDVQRIGFDGPFHTPWTSFLAGDLTPAFTTLPLMALLMGCATIVALPQLPSSSRNPESAGRGKERIALLGLAVGAVGASAVWGLPPAVIIGVGAIIIGVLHTLPRVATWPVARTAVLLSILMLGVALLAYLPYRQSITITARNMADPIRLTLSDVSLLTGGWLAGALVCIGLPASNVLRTVTREGAIGRIVAAFALLLVIGGAVVALGLNNAILFLLLTVLLLGIAAWDRLEHPAQLMTLLFLGVATLVILSLIVRPAPRFPLTTSSGLETTPTIWMLLMLFGTVAIGWCIGWLSRQRPSIRRWATPVGSLIVTIALVSTLLPSVLIGRQAFTTSPELRTLNVSSFTYGPETPSEAHAVDWILEHIDGLPVLLEAPGTTGHYTGRISAMTGLPSVIGWTDVEDMMRPGWGSLVRQRSEDVERIYRSTGDLASVEGLLRQYDVSLIYVGPLERARYDALSLRKFEDAADAGHLTRVYRQGNVVIYAWSPNVAPIAIKREEE